MTSPAAELSVEDAAANRCGRCRLGPREAIVRPPRRTARSIIRSPHPLAPYPGKLTERLEHWARTAPDRTFMAQRDAAGGWRTAELRASARQRAAHRQGAPEAPRSVGRAPDRDPVRQRHRARPARARCDVCRHPLCADLAGLFADLQRLRQAARRSSTLLTPGLVFAADGAAFARAIEAVVPPDVEMVVDAQSSGRAARRRCSPNCSLQPHRPQRSMPRMTRSDRTPSPSSCSRRARPACRRA